jgi:hypothetical protein
MAIPITNTIIRAFMIMPPSVWKHGADLHRACHQQPVRATHAIRHIRPTCGLATGGRRQDTAPMDEELSTEGVRNPLHTSPISDGYGAQGQIAHICTRYAHAVMQ